MKPLVAIRICSGVCGVLLLFGCSSTPRPGEPPTDVSRAAAATPGYKVGKPYQIKGVWYYPQVDYGYIEEGIASWYGPGFHGKATANGESYDMNDLTAAHRTLPMPSIVRVTNLENGRSLKLKVNDRGPFARERIIDVSRRASQLLGFHMQGTTPVRVEIVEDESRQLAAALGGAVRGGLGSVAADADTGRRRRRHLS
ncbi:MAG: septal ring lytic transglycosylase RlpA family protein [Rhodospirillales bacterium]|nr:septal ring lytic transglycosylase RlpA family protein [Rhodospirillales bacterium]